MSGISPGPTISILASAMDSDSAQFGFTQPIRRSDLTASNCAARTISNRGRSSPRISRKFNGKTSLCNCAGASNLLQIGEKLHEIAELERRELLDQVLGHRRAA